MQIPKDMIVWFIEQRMGGEQAAQAEAQLPDQVDHEQHADLLAQLEVVGSTGTSRERPQWSSW